jgi:hypothetical protein
MLFWTDDIGSMSINFRKILLQELKGGKECVNAQGIRK